MPSFLVLGIYLLLLHSGDARGQGGIVFSIAALLKMRATIATLVSILTSMTWRLLFPNSDIKAEMVSLPWNNFLRSLLRFIVVRSGYNEGRGRIRPRSAVLISQLKNTVG
jgi:hypothetical protein